MKWVCGANDYHRRLRDVVAEMLSGPSLSDFETRRIGEQVMHCFGLVSSAIWPLLAGAAFLVIVANVAQVGLNFNPQRLAINFGALNPMRGFNKLFSYGQGGLQLLMNLAKVSLVSLMAWSAISGRLGQIIGVERLGYLQIFALGADLVFSIGVRVGFLLLILAILRLRLPAVSRRAVAEDDQVGSEGRDAQHGRRSAIKQRRRQIALQRQQQKMKKDVPTADVVVTNPTHYAVALKYDQSKMRAPEG